MNKYGNTDLFKVIEGIKISMDKQVKQIRKNPILIQRSIMAQAAFSLFSTTEFPSQCSDHTVKATIHSSLLLNKLSPLILGDRSASSEDSAHLRFIFGILQLEDRKDLPETNP